MDGPRGTTASKSSLQTRECKVRLAVYVKLTIRIYMLLCDSVFFHDYLMCDTMVQLINNLANALPPKFREIATKVP